VWLLGWAKAMLGWTVEAVMRTEAHRVVRRWIVERSFAWLNHSRRLFKDDEITAASSEAFVQMTNIRLMTRRLAVL
jgi:transposase